MNRFYRVKMVGVRSGQVLVWYTDGDDIVLHRIERFGNRVYSRVVLWGDPDKWPEAARSAADKFLQEVPSESISPSDLAHWVLEAPPPPKHEYPAVYMNEPPIIRGAYKGVRWDVDLTRKKP